MYIYRYIDRYIQHISIYIKCIYIYIRHVHTEATRKGEKSKKVILNLCALSIRQ